MLALAAARKLRSWRDGRGILRFIDEELKVETVDKWQEQAALEFADPHPTKQHISLQACAGPGKSAVLAWCGWWFLATQGDKDDHPKGMATSINETNLRANLWAEYAKWQERSTFPRTRSSRPSTRS